SITHTSNVIITLDGLSRADHYATCPDKISGSRSRVKQVLAPACAGRQKLRFAQRVEPRPTHQLVYAVRRVVYGVRTARGRNCRPNEIVVPTFQAGERCSSLHGGDRASATTLDPLCSGFAPRTET